MKIVSVIVAASISAAFVAYVAREHEWTTGELARPWSSLWPPLTGAVTGGVLGGIASILAQRAQVDPVALGAFSGALGASVISDLMHRAISVYVLVGLICSGALACPAGPVAAGVFAAAALACLSCIATVGNLAHRETVLGSGDIALIMGAAALFGPSVAAWLRFLLTLTVALAGAYLVLRHARKSTTVPMAPFAAAAIIVGLSGLE